VAALKEIFPKTAGGSRESEGPNNNCSSGLTTRDVNIVVRFLRHEAH